jgi:hypothetical protein
MRAYAFLAAAVLVLAAAVLTATASAPARTTAGTGRSAPELRVRLSPYVAPAVQTHADCVNRLGPAMDRPRGWVRAGDVVRCRTSHPYIRARVHLWYWNGRQWVQAASTERSVRDSTRLDVVTTQTVCGWGWAPYWRETAEYSVAGVGTFHHETGYPGYQRTPYMHTC